MRPASIEDAAELLAAAAREGRRVRIGTDLETDGLARMLEEQGAAIVAATSCSG